MEILGAGQTSAAHAAAMNERMEDRPEIPVSVFALAGFHRTVETCQRAGPCDAEQAREAFAPNAREFYHLVFPALRRADCERCPDDGEGIVARLAGRPDPGLDRCERLKAAG